MSGNGRSDRSVVFDYRATVFGDEATIGLDRRQWGAIRMRRCLDSIREVRGRVLEVGCGAGRVARTVARHRPDLEVHACDLSEKALRLGRALGGSVRYAACDALGLPYPDATFDAVLVLDLMEHIPDVEAFLEEIRRVSKPGAVLHLHVPCEGNSGSLYRPLIALGIDLTARSVGHVHHFRRRDVLRHLRWARFDVVKTRNSMYPIGQFHDILGWLVRLSNSRKAPQPSACGRLAVRSPTSSGAATVAVPGPSLITRLRPIMGRPLWATSSHLLPWLQWVETKALSWQPFGSIGLCVTARLGH